MSEDNTPRTLQGQAFKRAKNPTSLNAGTPHDWEDLYQNTKQWDCLLYTSDAADE